MELDDLKEKWKLAEPRSAGALRGGEPRYTPDVVKEALARKISALERSGRGIRRMFMMEMIVVIVIYLFFFLVVWVFGEKVMNFLYKLVIVTAIGSIPATWRLYKSQKWITSMDYSSDLRSNMVAFVTYFRTSIRIYKLSSYLVVAILILIMLFDHDFIRLPMTVKIITLAYMIAASLATGPYIRWAYGRRAAVFEDFLLEQQKESAG